MGNLDLKYENFLFFATTMLVTTAIRKFVSKLSGLGNI